VGASTCSPDAAVRAASHVPNKRPTTLGAGHPPEASRSSARFPSRARVRARSAHQHETHAQAVGSGASGLAPGSSLRRVRLIANAARAPTATSAAPMTTGADADYFSALANQRSAYGSWLKAGTSRNP